MAETPGENFVFIILGIVFMVFIIIVFGAFLVLGFSLSNSTLCYTSSKFSNFFYNGLCLSNFFCLSSTLQAEGITPPSIGCSPTTQFFSSGSSNSQVFSSVATTLSRCWNQYGASQGLTVSPGSPLLCGVVSLNLGRNVTFSNLTDYLATTPYTTQVSCLNHTAAESCSNPLSSTNPSGFSCYTSNPTECVSNSNSYFQCFGQQGYSPFTTGYSSTTLPLTSKTDINTAVDNLSQYVCSAAEGCSFNLSIGTCAKPDGSTSGCSTPYTNFCKLNQSGDYVCTVGYDSITGSFEVPNSCQLTEAVKSTSTNNISYLQFLGSGLSINAYSYRNKTSGNSITVPLDSNRSIGSAQLYFYYINSLVGTRFPPYRETLPSNECKPITFEVNYPSAGIEYECSRALLNYGTLAYGLKTTALTTLAASGVVIGGTTYGCSTNTYCNTYVLSNLGKSVSTFLLKTTGLEQCGQSIIGFFQNIGSDILGQNVNFLSSGQIYICAVTS